MIQIPLRADLYFPKGEAPVLEFQDRKDLEHFISYLEKQVEILRGQKKQRLEYFSDGIYFDGELLDLRWKHYTILKAFEFVDKIPKIDLIEKVWGNSIISDSTVSVTICQFNAKMIDKGIFISLSDGIYTIYRP